MIQRFRDGLERTLIEAHARTLVEDDEGLTILAYALGAVFILVPGAAAVYAFSNGAAADASDILDNAIS